MGTIDFCSHSGVAIVHSAVALHTSHFTLKSLFNSNDSARVWFPVLISRDLGNAVFKVSHMLDVD